MWHSQDSNTGLPNSLLYSLTLLLAGCVILNKSHFPFQASVFPPIKIEAEGHMGMGVLWTLLSVAEGLLVKVMYKVPKGPLSVMITLCVPAPPQDLPLGQGAESPHASLTSVLLLGAEAHGSILISSGATNSPWKSVVGFRLTDGKTEAQ